MAYTCIFNYADLIFINLRKGAKNSVYVSISVKTPHFYRTTQFAFYPCCMYTFVILLGGAYMQNKDLWRAQLNNVNRALDHFLCGDGKYRAYPESSAQSLSDKVSGIIRNIADTEFTDALITTDYLYAPASTRHHGDFRGGLLCHSLLVTKRLLEFTIANNLEWMRVQSPVLVGMLHDLCKVYAYVVDDNGYTHSKYTYIPVHGHAEKSLAFIIKHGLDITEEEMLCILHHMGAYETDSWAEYDAAIRAYPNVLWTHTADMYASKVDGV